MRQFESVRDFCSVGKEKVKYSAIAECEIIHFVNCEISHAAFGSVRCEMKFAGIRVSEYFTRRRRISHFAEIFHLPEGQISLKKALARASAFFWSGLRGSNPPPRPWQGRALPNELNPHK